MTIASRIKVSLQSSTFDSAEMEKLIFAFSAHELNLCESELQVFDDIADRVEIQRLVETCKFLFHFQKLFYQMLNQNS